jgi:hypothetical protein
MHKEILATLVRGDEAVALIVVNSYLAPAQLLEEGAEHVPLWEA